MKQIQLYIKGNRVELFKDESIVLTQTVQNVKDVGKVFTPFSRSFTVPASKTNNKIFRHFYNFNIIGSVDPRLRMDARIDLNHSRFEKGKIKLNGVNMKNNKPDSYKITFFGSTVTLRDKFRNDKLDQLRFLKNFAFEYNSTNVIQTLQNGKDIEVDGVIYEDAFVVPLITHEDRLFYDSANPAANNLYFDSSTHGGVNWEQLKPAIRMDIIIKAIEIQYDIQFSDDFFTNTNPAYYDLRMWMHRKKGQIKEATSGNDIYINNFAWSSQTWGFSSGFFVHENGYTMRNIVLNPSWTEYDYENANTIPQQVTKYRVSHLFVPDDTTLEYTAVIKRNGVEVHRTEGITGNHIATLEHTANGDVVVEAHAAQSMTFQSMVINVEAISHYNAITYNRFVSLSMAVSPDFTFDTTREIPEIKVVDFLSGLFKLFNLVAYLDYDGTIIVKTLDSWYAESDKTFDITKYVDSTQSTIDVALPYREILFDYAGKESFFTKNHNALFNYQHGVERYRGEDDELLSGSDYTIKVPFEHHKFERLYDQQSGSSTDVQWGWSVDDNQQSILGKPLLFYPIHQRTATPIAVQTTSTNHQSILDYWIPSNSISLDPNVSTQNLNFRAEVNEYAATVFSDTLFSKYYRKYISETFDPSRRLTKFKARLPISFLLNFELNDLVIVFTRVYRINSIQTNLSTGISNLELINVPESTVAEINNAPLYTDISGSLGKVDTTNVTIDIDDNYKPENYP